MRRAFILLVALIASAGTAAAQDAQSRLWDAAVSGDSAAAAQAIADGAKVDSLDTRTSVNGRRALNWAALNGHVPVIKLLLAKGASINLKNRTGFTPLHHAAEMGRKEAAIVLVSAGADRSMVNAVGLTPADVASAQGHGDVAALLAKP